MRSAIGAVVAGLVLVSGCVRDVEEERATRVFGVAAGGGEIGWVDDPVVAVGSTLRLELGIEERLGDGSTSRSLFVLTGAYSETPSILEIVSVHAPLGPDIDRHVVVRGVREGRARLVVEGYGRTYEVVVRVAPVASAAIADPMERVAVPASRLVYLAGTTARLDLELTARGGGVARGDRAIDAAHVRVAGPASVVDVADTHVTLRLDAPGNVTVAALGARRTLTVVPATDLFALELAVSDTSWGGGCLAHAWDTHSTMQAAPADRSERFSHLVVRARTADDRIVASLDGLLDLRTETPDHCTVRPTTRERDVVGLLRFFRPASTGYQPAAYDLLGAAPGTCTLTATAGTTSTRRDVVVQ